jgi:hypothetical protein
MILLIWDGAFFKPKGNRRNSKYPSGVKKVVLAIDCGLMASSK